MKYKAKKMYRGHVSVRSHIVDKCISKEQDLEIEHENKKITVPLDVLKDRFQFHKTAFKSKINKGQTYELVDFKFDTN